MSCREVTPTEEEAINRAVAYLVARTPGSEWSATVRVTLGKHAILTAYRLGTFPPPSQTVVVGSEEAEVQVVAPATLSTIAIHLLENEPSLKLDGANLANIAAMLETLLPGSRVLRNADDIKPRQSKAADYAGLRPNIAAPTFHPDRFYRTARLWFLNRRDLEEWRIVERGGKVTLDRTTRLKEISSFDE